MQRLILIFGFLLALSKCGKAQNDGRNLYSRRYEKLDVDTVLSSPRLVMNYVECLLNRKPCPPEGKELKRLLPEALRTKCARCWPSQKEGALKVITKLYYDYPNQYNDLRLRWDPTGEYHRRFEEYLRDQSFNIIPISSPSNDDINTGQQSIINVNVAQPNNVPLSDELPQTPQVPRITTTKAPTSVPVNPNFTLRPTRQDTVPIAQDEQQPSLIANRFGSDSNQFADPIITTIRTSSSFTPTLQPNRVPAFTSVNFVYEPTFSTNTMIDFNTRNPIINLINRITTKFTNTAEFVAGMLRNKTT